MLNELHVQLANLGTQLVNLAHQRELLFCQALDLSCLRIVRVGHYMRSIRRSPAEDEIGNSLLCPGKGTVLPEVNRALD